MASDFLTCGLSMGILSFAFSVFATLLFAVATSLDLPGFCCLLTCLRGVVEQRLLLHFSHLPIRYDNFTTQLT